MQQQYYPQVFSVESSSILFSTVFTIISVVNNQEEIYWNLLGVQCNVPAQNELEEIYRILKDLHIDIVIFFFAGLSTTSVLHSKMLRTTGF